MGHCARRAVTSGFRHHRSDANVPSVLSDGAAQADDGSSILLPSTDGRHGHLRLSSKYALFLTRLARASRARRAPVLRGLAQRAVRLEFHHINDVTGFSEAPSKRTT